MSLTVLLRTVSRNLILLICVAGLSTKAHSQHMNSKDSPCKTVVVTVDLANCLWNAWKAEDHKLNNYYQVVSRHTQDSELEKLRQAEKAWITFRDLNCDAERELYDGGTARGPAYNACLEAMTRHRLQELQTMYDWRVNK